MKNILKTLGLMTFLWSHSVIALTETNGTSANYSEAAGWTSGVPDLVFWDGSKGGNIKHDVTCTGNISATNLNNLTVFAGATLTVTGNLALGNNGRVTVQVGGTVIVQGKVTLGNLSVLSNDGTLNVVGNIEMANGARPIFGGVTNVGGAFTGTGASSYAMVTGVLSIAGELNLQGNSTMGGTGIVEWGSAYIFTPGSSYIICSNGSRFGTDGDGHVDPPANPLNLSTCSSGILPVELVFFGASSNNDVLEVSWTTASEINAKFYEVLASEDGANWETINHKTASGNFDRVTHYQIIEKSMAVQYKYLKLKQVDFDDRAHFSSIVAVDYSHEGKLVNVQTSGSTIAVTHNILVDKIVFSIIDLQGRTVFYEDKQGLEEGLQTTLLNTNIFQKGIYLIVLETKGNRFTKKVYMN